MSYESGWKALNQEFSDRVPRTEYSAENHWDLIARVTGIDVSDKSNRKKAQQVFLQAWDYAFMWSTLVHSNYLEQNGGRVTKMGHAVYSEDQAGSSDYNTHIQKGFTNLDEVYALDPVREYGSFPQEQLIQDFETHERAQRERWGDTLTMSGVYVSMFSGLIEIFGWEMLLLAMGSDPKRFGKVIDGYFEWVKPFFEAYAKTNIPVMMSHDDLVWSSGPITHPDWYRTYIFPHLKKLWGIIKEAGKKLIFTCDGDFTAFFDDIMEGEVAPDMVVMEPWTNMAEFAQKYGSRCGFVGNADCRILLSGTKEDIYKEVKRCMDIGKAYPGFILAVGNHLPSNTPVDNALYYHDAYLEYSKR
jgi:hypothetical protein